MKPAGASVLGAAGSAAAALIGRVRKRTVEICLDATWGREAAGREKREAWVVVMDAMFWLYDDGVN